MQRASRSNLISSAAAKITIVAILALGSPALAKRENAATDAEKHAAMVATDTCYVSKIAEFDDGISDALTIGRVVAGMCRTTVIDMAHVFAQGENGDVKQMMAAQFVDSAPASASELVLVVRSAKRNGKPLPVPH